MTYGGLELLRRLWLFLTPRRRWQLGGLLLCMLIGTALVHPLAAAPCLGLVAYSAFAARREERDMEQRFPDAYPEYKRHSKFLVPFLL